MANAIILTIGNEILIGQIVDTNSAWLAEQLTLLGFTVEQKIALGDDSESISNTLSEISGMTGLVLITGGLGPTRDDITRQVLFGFFDSKPVENKDVLKKVEKFLAERGVSINELNKRQAIVADNCRVLSNEIGTAPGMWFEKDGTVFVAMPGVPFEMMNMFEKHLKKLLTEKFKRPSIIHKNILTTGIGESILAKKIEGWENSLPEYLKLAYLPTPGLLKLRITAKGKESSVLLKEIDSQIGKLKQIIPEYIYGFDNETLEGIVGMLLKDLKKTLSVAESCTGGYVGHLVTSVPGSSAYFKGGIIAYANEIKTRFLDVPDEILKVNGAVSKEVVCIMAKEVMQRFNSDYAIAVSGIAGPDGGTDEKPVGTTWIAVATKEKIVAEKFLLGEDRGRNITKASIAALNMLRKELIK
jgi:nicotinamide-nucleotide amidase